MTEKHNLTTAEQSPTPDIVTEIDRTVPERPTPRNEQHHAEAIRSREQSENDKEAAHHEALEAATTAEQPTPSEKKASTERRRHGTPTNADRSRAYLRTMDEARSHMSPTGRALSKFIHAKGVEETSEALGKTVARPNAILSGSMFAFFVVLGVFLIARHFGYPLSGSETILAFTAGWLLGIVFDFLKAMITGGNKV